MISFKDLGSYGRLGNQLFQYAFLRSKAEKLQTQFYCPEWIGDSIFMLNDVNNKVPCFEAHLNYMEFGNGFDKKSLEIKDDTNIAGYFQSDMYFKREDVMKWFSFNETMFKDVTKKYSYIDFANSTGIHIRLGDYATPQLVFYTPRPEYFKKALQFIDKKNKVLVFSDDTKKAKKYLKGICDDFVFIENNKDYEDFYLMTKCRNLVCSSSSFSWWAGYLNVYSDKKIIVPKFWFLPGCGVVNNDIFVEGWTKIPAHKVYDYYYIRYIPHKIYVLYLRIVKAILVVQRKGFSALFKEIKKFLHK